MRMKLDNAEDQSGDQSNLQMQEMLFYETLSFQTFPGKHVPRSMWGLLLAEVATGTKRDICWYLTLCLL